MGTTTLINRLQQSGPQPEAWGLFAELYAGELLAWARRHGLREADAEDVAQSILTNIRELLRGYERREGTPFGRWLFRVTANACRTRLRRLARETGADGLSSVVDGTVVSFEELEEAEHHRQLTRRAMTFVEREFDAKRWAAFLALAVEGRAAADVATELGITRTAVHLARFRVVARLREVLRDLLE